jgi:hypothetical protein
MGGIGRRITIQGQLRGGKARNSAWKINQDMSQVEKPLLSKHGALSLNSNIPSPQKELYKHVARVVDIQSI